MKFKRLLLLLLFELFAIAQTLNSNYDSESLSNFAFFNSTLGMIQNLKHS